MSYRSMSMLMSPPQTQPSSSTSTSTSSSRRSRKQLNRRTVLTSLLLQIVILLSTSTYTKSSFAFVSAADVADFNPSNPNPNSNNQFQILSEKREQIIDYTKQNIIQPIYEQYDQLPPKGKFVSTAFVGFTASRFTVSTTIQVAKYFGAAFIISEALNSAGILDNIMNSGDDYDDDDTIQLLKQKVSTKVNECRLFVREHFLNVEKMKSQFDECLEKDRVGTLGFTTGAVAALVL